MRQNDICKTVGFVFNAGTSNSQGTQLGGVGECKALGGKAKWNPQAQAGAPEERLKPVSVLVDSELGETLLQKPGPSSRS